MKIMPPDDPTAVYPIGQLDSLSEDAQEVAEEVLKERAPEPEEVTMPPIEHTLEAEPAGSRGGFSPLIAVAVLAIGGLMAASVLALMTVLLFLLQ